MLVGMMRKLIFKVFRKTVVEVICEQDVKCNPVYETNRRELRSDITNSRDRYKETEDDSNVFFSAMLFELIFFILNRTYKVEHRRVRSFNLKIII